MAIRLTRSERKERTRADLIAAARRVFLRHGFHAASLDEIAEEAGFTKGAVYSNFSSKDDLFLAVLAEHYEKQIRAYTKVILAEGDLEDIYRAAARLFIVETQTPEPEWTPLVTEFMTHASRREPMRRAVVEIRERFLDAIGQLIEDRARRHGVEYRLPFRDVARGSGAIMRGMAVERLLDPDAVSPELFEELHTAYMRGMTRVPGTERNEP